MYTETAMRPMRGVVGALVAAVLALGTLSVAGQAQEFQLTRGDLETSLENPGEELTQLQEERGAKQVTVVGISDVIRDEQQVADLREQHQEGIRRFQKELRDNQNVARALGRTLEEYGLGPGDVLAVHVATRSTPEAGAEGQGEKQQTAAHKTVYVVVTGSTPQPPRGEGQPGPEGPGTGR